MPTFTQLVLSAPRGFVSGCKAYNLICSSESPEAEQVVQACRVSHKEDRPVNASQFYVGNKQGCDHMEEVKVLSYIVYCFEHATPQPTVPEMASALDGNTFLTRDAITAIIAAIDVVTASKDTSSVDGTDHIPDNVFQELRKTSNFGRLSNMQWRLSVALESSRCKNLNTPLVSLSFDIVDNNGSKSAHTTELTYPDFLRFSSEFEKINHAMNAM